MSRGDRSPRFQRLKAPVKDELEDLVQLISQRVGHCLERQGLLEQDTENAWLELDPADDTDATPNKPGWALRQILGSYVYYRIAVGPQQGRKAFMIRTIRPIDSPDPGLERLAKANGFSLHAGVSREGHQKDKRERLCRYIARPAVAVPRLSLSSTGKVVYTLKTPYRDGTRACPALSGTQVAFERGGHPPVDFIARLAALARARSDPNPGSISRDTMAFWLGAAIRLITGGADWSLRQNEAKVQCVLPVVKSSHRSSVTQL